MGDVNGIVHDDNNIWLFPSTLYDYPEMVVGEFGSYYFLYGRGGRDNGYESSSIFTDMGIHYKFGEAKPLILGLYFTLNQPFDIPHNPVDWDWDDFPYYKILSNRRIDIFAACRVGENTAGLHVNYINSSYRYDEDTLHNQTGQEWYEEEGVTNFALDFGYTAKRGKLDISAGINLLGWTDIEWKGHDETKPDGNFGFHCMARYFYEFDQKITLVPYGGLYYDKIGVEYFDSTNSDIQYRMLTDRRTYKDLVFDLGSGLNYSPAAGITAIGNIGFTFGKNDQKYGRDTTAIGDYDNNGTLDTVSLWLENEYKESSIIIPYFRIGLDAVVFDWLDLRMGATSRWYSNRDENIYTRGEERAAGLGTFSFTHKYFESGVWNHTYLGAGFRWGNLKIDTYINPRLVLRGFNFISGDDDYYYGYDFMNYQVSILYEMF
jgi:hypothetical protein